MLARLSALSLPDAREAAKQVLVNECHVLDAKVLQQLVAEKRS